MLYVLSFVAGLVSLLNPCVLPLVPLVVMGAARHGLRGLFYLSVGLVVVFTVVGTLLASAGTVAGLDAVTLRQLAAVVLLISGFLMLFPSVSVGSGVGALLQPVFAVSHRWSDWFDRQGPQGQCGVGALLGVIWTPCTGPTLGVALGLAAQRDMLWQAGLMMLLFSLGTVVGLLVLGFLLRSWIRNHTGNVSRWAHRMKVLFGAVMAGLGVLILAGWDKQLEVLLLALLPDLWLDFTTRF